MIRFKKTADDCWQAIEGVERIGTIYAVKDCSQCGGLCYQYRKVTGRITHWQYLSEAKDEALKK